jgi:hypothetical protein
MDAACSELTDSIVVKQITSGAKLISTGCEAIPGGNATVDETLCCNPSDDANECVTPYVSTNHDVMYSYHRYCTGLDACPRLQAANMPTPATCGAGYLPTTNFMYMDYYCVGKQVQIHCS